MKTPEEIKKGLECCAEYGDCSAGCPYNPIKDCGNDLYSDAIAYIQQLERERDAAVKILVGLEYPIPCESDELGGSEYCEEGCKYKSPQKQCWSEYFGRLGVQEVE